MVDVATANRKLEIVEFLAARDKVPDHVVTNASNFQQDVPVLEFSQSGTALRKPHSSHELLQAARRGDLDAVRALLSQGADTAAVDKYSYTALHRAAEGGHTEIVKRLLVDGANIEQSAEFGITALHCTIVYAHVDTVEALLARGVKTEAYTTGKDSNLYHYTNYNLVKQAK